MKRRSVWMNAGSFALAIVLATASASADPAQIAAAEALFDEARSLAAEGKHDEACPKLEESQRLDPAIGTQYHLADCYERTGRIASAWAAFLDVSYAARQAGQPEREKVARQRAEDLVPRLPRLLIEAPEHDLVAGLQVRRDGIVVGAGQWKTAVPVDSGKHVVEASAPGYEAWGTSIMVADAATTRVVIPRLQRARPAVTAPPPVSPPPVDDTGTSHKTYALLLGGLGVVGVAVGSTYGLMARSKNEESMQYCAEKNLCDPEGVSLREEARTDAAVSSIAFSVAIGAVAGGIVLWSIADSQPGNEAEAKLRASARGFALEGTW